MISTFPYYPKSYQPSGSSASGLASPKHSSGWSDMLGIVADPASSYGPSQQALGIWGSNTSPGESAGSTSWEDVLGSYQNSIVPQAEPPAAETPAPEPAATPAPTRYFSGSGLGGGGAPITLPNTPSSVLGMWGPGQAQIEEENRIAANAAAIGWGRNLALGYYRYLFE